MLLVRKLNDRADPRVRIAVERAQSLSGQPPTTSRDRKVPVFSVRIAKSSVVMLSEVAASLREAAAKSKDLCLRIQAA